MKRNRLFILGIVTVLVALLSLTLVSGTFAKYTSSATGSDSARVAKYQVTYKAGSSAAVDVTGEKDGEGHLTGNAQVIVFDLFNTVLDTKNNAEVPDEDYSEAHVKVGSEETIIAPGTKGEFSFEVENKSEVTVKYTVDYTFNNADVPLEYRVSTDGGVNWSAWATELTDVAETTLAFPNGSPVKSTYTIQWRWAFIGSESTNYTSTQTDITDTTLGLAGNATPTVTATILFTQVD